LLTDLVPWQHSGVQFKRTWPIAQDKDTLITRWKHLVSYQNQDAGGEAHEELYVLRRKKAILFKETRDRKIGGQYKDVMSENTLPVLLSIPADSPCPAPMAYGYRSFDRQWCFLDNRLGDYLRPPLCLNHSDKQIYFASIFTQPISNGPALTLSAALPDLDYFSGRGAKNIVPLYRDAAATQPNILTGLLELLAAEYRQSISAEDFVAYVYAVLAHPGFTARFHTELATKEIRLPLTRESALFNRAVCIGRRLIWLHSYGERFIPAGLRPDEIPPGVARCERAVPGTPEGYPERFEYNDATRTLHLGAGEFVPVSYDVFNFEVSGLKVVQSWLKYRMKRGAGKKSSPLDDIRPERWTAEMTTELLNLLWILEATLAGYPEQKQILEDILHGSLFWAEELPETPEAARQAPERVVAQSEQLRL
jgi:hypothetical protein